MYFTVQDMIVFVMRVGLVEYIYIYVLFLISSNKIILVMRIYPAGYTRAHVNRFDDTYGVRLRPALEALADPPAEVVSDPQRAWAPFKEVCRLVSRFVLVSQLNTSLHMHIMCVCILCQDAGPDWHV